MTVWKIGSRWNETGAPGNSVLHLFVRHSILFVGISQRLFQQIQVGDLVAITDGTRVVAIGKVISVPQSITQLNLNLTADREIDDYIYDGIIACKAAITQLEAKDVFPVFEAGRGKRGAVFRLLGVQIRERTQQLYARYHRELDEEKQFAISARSCTLLGAADCLLQPMTCFRVPVYQRPYSWSEENIRRFVSDALISYRGTDGNSKPEPMFIGAMQVSSPKPIDTKNGIREHEVIDGQQRLSTLLVLLKVLLASPAVHVSELPMPLRFDWLETNVNGGVQSNFLHEFLATSAPSREGSDLNPYFRSAAIIRQIIEEESTADGDGPASLSPLDPCAFAKYLLNCVYFVVIETRAGLSKTLQIFNAINTAGLDLSSADIFKLRLFEYLRDVKKQGDGVFGQIDSLYKQVDVRNGEAGRNVSSIGEVLGLYQHVLIARHGLPAILHGFGGDTFFQRLLDVLLKVNGWPNFAAAMDANFELSLEDLLKLVEARYNWERMYSSLTAEARCATQYIWTSRYGSFWIFPVLFVFNYGENTPVAEQFVQHLSKFLIVSSTIHGKVVREIRSYFWQELAADMFGPSRCPADDLITRIEKRTREKKNEMETAVAAGITGRGRRTVKNLICRLSAMLEEKPERRIVTDEKLVKALFESEIDIEHIEPANNKDGSIRQAIWDEWGDDLNGVGNLMVLERSLNRSISNESYATCKLPAYAKSQFQVVRSQKERFPTWDLEACRKRKKYEINKLMRYLMGE